MSGLKGSAAVRNSSVPRFISDCSSANVCSGDAVPAKPLLPKYPVSALSSCHGSVKSPPSFNWKFNVFEIFLRFSFCQDLKKKSGDLVKTNGL